MVVDELWDGTKTLGKVVIIFAVMAVLGGLLAGLGDVALGAALVGTPLGPSSVWSPLAWTVVAGLLLYAIKEVSD